MQVETKESLFQPGQPVSADRFKGREEVIQEVLKYHTYYLNSFLMLKINITPNL